MQTKPVYAGFAARLAAYLIDLLLVGLGLLLCRVPFLIWKLFAGEAFLFRELLFTYSLYDILFYLLGKAYFVLLTYFTGGTLGKKCLRLQVVSRDGGAPSFWCVLYRETIGRYLSELICCIGYLMVPLDGEKRSLADRLADTRVIYAFSAASGEEHSSCAAPAAGEPPALPRADGAEA